MSKPARQHYIVHLDVEATALDFSSALALSDTVRGAIGRMDLGRCTTSVEVLDDGVPARSIPALHAQYRGEFLG